jgi:hypothetical protein
VSWQGDEGVDPVPNEDLSSIRSLAKNHRRGLEKLGVTSVQPLADADPGTIHTKLQRLRPPPSEEEIKQWQREARAMLRDAHINRSEWPITASFAVIFARHQVDGGWEHRLEAQQTEREPEPPPEIWPGWGDCEPLWDWMRRQLPGNQAEPAAGAVDRTGMTPAVEPATASAVPGGTERAKLRIDSATISEAADNELNLVTDGKTTETLPEDLTSPVRLNLTVSGGRPGQQVQAAVWFCRQTEPGWSPQEPVTISRSGRAEFDLSSVPAGEHQIRLLAWATDAGASLAGVTLPKLTFLQPAP